ncbi:actin-1 isoform X3 [Puntigrus tetrazona]|nr:actin-1 isoform X3 [Puntigrus tetrazona]
MDSFVQEFLSVVSRLPSCIWTLQALSRRPVPADLERLQEFCCVNQARFQQLRRDLGLDDLLKRCEGLLEKLRFPEDEPCFRAMAGTLLYTHTALEMLHNYNRITAAVEKVELLWQQVISRAHVQLQLLRLQREAQQIQEQMLAMHREKVQPYRIEVAKDVHRAEELRLEFEASIYTYTMALVRRAEDVMHTLAETVPLGERKAAEPWLEDLAGLKEKLSSAAQCLNRTLRTVSDFHHSSNTMSDYKTPIVLDSGSGLMKAGFADQDLPTSVFPSVIGRPKYEEVMNGSVEREQYVGHDAQHMRGVLTLKYPIRNGVVTNWDEMEMIWHHAFQQLCVCPEDHPVLLTEAAMNPLQNRQRSVELMFEVFGVPLTFVALQAVLALYASGRTTGVVLDSGDGVTHSVPVFEGYCLPHAVQRLDLAGSHVTLQLQKLLLEQGVCLQTSAELEIVREMKERCCCVALDFAGELKSASELPYTLPDGRLVSLASERFRAPEILFRPELIGRDHYGMHESLFRSVLQSDIDLRRSFLGNILLSGGNTLLPGLPARLQQEMSALCPAGPSVRVSSPSDRDFSVWRGGAALAHTAELGGAWISADEYEEFGPQIVFRKCF